MFTLLNEKEFNNQLANRTAVKDGGVLTPDIQAWMDYIAKGIDSLYLLSKEAERLSNPSNSMHTFFVGKRDANDNKLANYQDFHNMYKSYIPTYDLLTLQRPFEKCTEEIQLYTNFDKEWTNFSRQFGAIQKEERKRIPYLYGAIPHIKQAIISATNEKQKEQLTQLLEKAIVLANDNKLAKLDIHYTDSKKLHNGNLNPLSKIWNRYKVLELGKYNQNYGFEECRRRNPDMIQNILKICNDYTSTNNAEIKSLIKGGVSQYEFFKMWETENGLEKFIDNANQTLKTLSNVISKFEFAKLTNDELAEYVKLEENFNDLDYYLRKLIVEKDQREAYVASRFKYNTLDSVENPQSVELHKLASKLRKSNKYAGFDKLVDASRGIELNEELVY